jgi:carboxyl-terminal processing protease
MTEPIPSTPLDAGVLVEPTPPPESPADPQPVPAGQQPVRAPGATTGARGRRQGVAIVAIALVAVLAGSALFVSGWSLGRQAALTPGTPVDEAQAFQPFWDTYRAVTERYAGGDVDRKALIEGAIKGMITALGDPYSMYLTADEYRDSLQGLSGEFEGIGATIGAVDATGATSACTKLTTTDCRMVVVAPIKGSPADLAGLLPGDVITKIDGKPVAGQSLDAARGLVRGPKDTAVTLTIVRGDEAPRDVEIVRAVVIQPEVEARLLAGDTVGYLKLSGFSDHAADQLDEALGEDVQAGIRKIILDLRGNPGGFVTAARDIASEFLADGTVFWQRDAEGNLTETLAKPGGKATDPGIQVVLLVDGGSASASEIVAGALHDRARATLVGTKTFGKGTVQQWTQLEDDSGGFRLTTARWLTPDRTWIHGKGIVPDVVVTQAPEKPGDDPILDAGLGVLGVQTSGVVRLGAGA